MNKRKILTPILTTGAIAAAVTPLTVLTSCDNLSKWVSHNFVEVLYGSVYEPVVTPLEDNGSLDTDEKIIEAYLNNIHKNGQILKDDLCYSANLLREDSEVMETYGSGREGVFKFQWNVADVEVNVAKHEINFTLGVYLAGNWLGWQPLVTYNTNCFRNINVYMEIRRSKPFKIESVKRSTSQFKTNDLYLTLVNTDPRKEGDLLETEYELKISGKFWYYSGISELIKYENINYKKQTYNSNDELSGKEIALTQLANRYTFCFTEYLLNRFYEGDTSEIYIASNYLSNFKIPK